MLNQSVFKIAYDAKLKKKVRSTFLVLVLSLSACATAEDVVGPGGDVNKLVTCDLVKDCYEKAREVCGGNYKILNSSSQTSGNGVMVSSQQNILVKCDK